jgi:hypothetical protein
MITQAPTETPTTEPSPAPAAVEPVVTPPPAVMAEPPPAAVDYTKLAAPDAIKNDLGMVDAIRGIAAKHNVPLEAAQGIVDQLGAQAKAAADEWATIREDWKAQIAADKEIGGPELEANRAIASKVIDAYGTPELREWLNESGIGDHPLLVKLLVKAGKDLAESPMLRAGDVVAVDPLKAMYSNSPQMFQ